MGHEFAGEIVEVGPEARSDWKVGDRICALPFIGCGRCAACLTGDNMHCPEVQTTGLGQVPGGYAELVRVGSGEALHLPESVSDEDGATVEPLSVGLHAVHTAQLERGQNVLVIGAGARGAVGAHEDFDRWLEKVAAEARSIMLRGKADRSTFDIVRERFDDLERYRDVPGH